VALEELNLASTNAGPKVAAALVKWLRVDGAAPNLKKLILGNNVGEAEWAAIEAACPEGVKPDFE